MKSLSKIKEEAARITSQAGEVVLSFYQDAAAFKVREKTPDNPVTEADLAADSLLKEKLKGLLPAAGWLSEETGDSPERLNKELVWVVDPLDGTKEFVMGIPEFTISVALCQNGRPIVGVIFNPVTNELFAAAAGEGLTLNHQPTAVSTRSRLNGALVEASRSERKRGEFAPFEEQLEIRTMGSVAYKLARLAAGLSDATWSRGPKHEWDICAGVLLIEEGGGRCVNLDDRPFQFNQPFPKVNGIVADNGHLHNEVVALLAPHRDTVRKEKPIEERDQKQASRVEGRG